MLIAFTALVAMLNAMFTSLTGHTMEQLLGICWPRWPGSAA